MIKRKGFSIMMQITPRLTFIHLLEKDRPQAVAWIKGNEDNSRLGGLVKFFSTLYGGVLIGGDFRAAGYSDAGLFGFLCFAYSRDGRLFGKFYKDGRTL